MAKSYNGEINLPSSLNIQKTKPLDTRTVVDSVDDLTSIEFPYPGLIVNIKGTNQIYVLTKVDESDGSTTKDMWQPVGADNINDSINNAITWIELSD